jgi:4-hydroxybenzoyl-CoA thioesterase
MLINRRTIRIEWGDCDPAGIVYFPRYFVYFDNCTVGLFESATKLKKSAMTAKYGAAGIPMVDVKARFLLPSQYGDDVIIESQITEFGRSSFNVQHRLLRGEELAVECTEKRVWSVPDPDRPGGLKAAAIPQEIKDSFAKSGTSKG